MPAKYADLLNELLPLYYSQFKDRHRLLIHYLIAEPSRRTAAVFQASGPVLQKVVQMIADYTNDPGVRRQLGELRSGVRPYAERDIRPVIDRVLQRTVPPDIWPRLTVDYDAIGSGTIAQAHLVRIDAGETEERGFIVKVKRPGLQGAIEREMAMVESIATTAFTRKLLRDVKTTLHREMDLSMEAREIAEAVEVYNQGRVTVAPTVPFIPPSDSLVAVSFVKGRTLDRINGKLDEILELLDPDADRVNFSIARHYVANLLATEGEAIYELIQVWFREAIFESGFFHGDLHSGNVFLDIDEEDAAFERRFSGNHLVTLIDFGNAGRFT
jgi:ubiquinone biosynthesis protein